MTSHRLKPLAGLLIACWVLLRVTQGAPAEALTRTEALATATSYAEVQYTITDQNVWPNAPCLLGPGFRQVGDNGYGAHLDIGSYTGEVYGYGLFTAYYDLASDLLAGATAGDYDALYKNSTASRLCLLDQAAGIDCSGLALRAWGYGAHIVGSSGIMGPALSQRVWFQDQVKYSDIVAVPDDHVRLIGVPPTVYGGTYTTLEAVGDDIHNRVVPLEHNWNDDVINGPYEAYASVKLKDDPVSQIARLDVDVANGAPVVRWETIIEQGTASFAVWGAADANSPYEQLSPEIPSRGDAHTGAVYEYALSLGGGTPAFVKLMETETTGRVISHGVRSLAEAQAAVLARNHEVAR